MRKSVVVLIAACIVFVLFGQSRAQGEFFMRFEREDNFITLSCQNGADRTSVPNAQFFRNNLRVDNGRQDGILTFHIDRAREGNYTCGKNRSVQSNFESIIAFPNTEVDRIPPRQHHLEGEHVLLDCAISPGALLQQYYVTWSISGRVIYRTSPGSSPEILDDRYVLVPSNLSLIINNVQLSDASENYLCVLSVADPNSANLRDYDVLRNINISLVVLAHPAITTPPHSRIVTEGNETMFSCSATGSPLPVISWLHNSKPVTSGNSRYTVRVPVPGSVNSTVTTSTLTLSSVVSLDSGSVTCIASASSDADIGNRELESDRQSAQLSVLGSFQDIEIRITVDRDVIFDIDLPIKLADPVRLYLEYHNVDNKKMDTKTTSAMYTNLSNIRHIEFDSDVNFERFEVSVALVSVTNVRGPLIAAGRYDKSVPNTPLRELIRQTPVIAITATLGLLVICSLIFIAFIVNKCLLYQYKKRCQSTTDRGQKKLNKADKLLSSNKSKSECTFSHDSNNETGSAIACEFIGPEPSSGGASSSKRKRLQKQKNVEETDNGLEMAERGQKPFSDHTFAKFLANKLFIGLTHPQHGETIHKIVKKIMDEAQVQRSTPAQHGGSGNGASAQRAGDQVENNDENKN